MTQRILVVDDESHILHVLSLKLGKAGYEVLTAVDGEEGLHMARETKPDLVITDIQMPYMTGLELSRELAQDEITAAIPVLILTARGYALSTEDLETSNIREVLSKPFSPRSLIELVSSTLASTENRSEAA
ncbi:MAG: response regulator [Phycisphaerales bacterium]|nr:response regulator [Phycisphaerales bacterium]